MTAEPRSTMSLFSVAVCLRRRILLFSLTFGLIASLLGTIPFFITKVYLPDKNLQETKQKSFNRIPCDQEICDVSEIANDWEFSAADYILDKQTSFLLNIDPPRGDFSGFALHRSDPAFIERFQTAASVSTPAGESWRLYSAVKQLGSKRVAIMVGYAEKVSWKMDLPSPPVGVIDARLKDQLAKVEAPGESSDRRAPYAAHSIHAHPWLCGTAGCIRHIGGRRLPVELQREDRRLAGCRRGPTAQGGGLHPDECGCNSGKAREFRSSDGRERRRSCSLGNSD